MSQAMKSTYGKYFAKRSIAQSGDGPRRIESGTGKLPFFPTLFPVLAHPDVIRGADESANRRMLARHCHNYFSFTTKLELKMVNPLATDIALGDIGIELPRVIRDDAFRTVTDESHHAEEANDIIRAVAEVTGVPPQAGDFQFFGKFQQIERGLTTSLEKQVLSATATIVSETLVSGVLNAPADDTVMDAVREAIRQHRNDEAIHKVLFERFAREFWHTLTPELRRAAALQVPHLIRGFLDPDKTKIGANLMAEGFTNSEVAKILAETYPEVTIKEYCRHAACHTVSLFQELGALDMPQTCEAFAEKGLVR